MMSHPQTFPCPNCREIINDTMQTCRYCSSTVDPVVAQSAAHLQAQVNQSCSDASYLRTAAVVMFVFLGLSFIPLVPLVGWGFIFTFLAVIVMFIRWQSKFGRLRSADPDYQKARRSKNIALALWLIAIPVGFVIKPIVDMMMSRMLSR